MWFIFFKFVTETIKFNLMKKIFTILGIATAMSISAQNLVLNPGFENWTAGKPDSWITVPTTYAQVSNPVHSGASAISVTSANSTQTLGATDIDVTEGTTYTFSGWYLDNSTSARMRYWGQWRDASAAIGSSVPGFDNMQQADYSTDAAVWKQFTVTGAAPTGAVKMRLSVRAYKDTDGTYGGIVYFDDIYFGVGGLGTIDIKEFDKQVQINTLVKDQLTLRLPSRSTVNVYTADGKLVSSNRVNSGESINMSNVAKGMYIVTVQDNFNNKVSRKVIKE